MQSQRAGKKKQRIWRLLKYLVLFLILLLCCYIIMSIALQTRVKVLYKKPFLYEQPNVMKAQRTDVLSLTPWLAPIIWSGTYNPAILEAQFSHRDVRIGITAFAIKKYIGFVQELINSAEKFFMIGYKVHYYVFTDRVSDIPVMKLNENRSLTILKVPSYPRWQDVSMRRMEMLRNFSQEGLFRQLDFLVCVDVDMKFSDDVGVEILSDLFGTLHLGMLELSRELFTYERNPQSAAYIPIDEGDFYYAGGFFGGSVEEVYKLTNFCHNAMMTDQAKNIEALWHDESYLNKYLLYHKPTKILSPEYLWDDNFGFPYFLKTKRFLAVRKDHNEIRNRR